MPDQNRLTEIQEREQAATPGPWRRDDDPKRLERFVVSEDATLDISFGYLGNNTQADVAFVAEARQDIPWLLSQLEQARQRLNEVLDLCDRATTQANRWENPLPVPEWVAAVRQAADGEVNS